MSFDQTVQILGVAGSWIAGLGSLAAAVIALWLARRVSKVSLQSWVGIRTTFGGSGPQQDVVSFSVTNVGERPVTISAIGWCFGKGKRRPYFIQMLSGVVGAHLPKKIEHGETATFIVSLSESPDFFEKFAKHVIDENYTNKLKTIRAQIHTSVGHTEDVAPKKNILDKLDEAISRLQNDEG